MVVFGVAKSPKPAATYVALPRVCPPAAPVGEARADLSCREADADGSMVGLWGPVQDEPTRRITESVGGVVALDDELQLACPLAVGRHLTFQAMDGLSASTVSWASLSAV